MAGTLTEDCGISLRPSATDGTLSEQRCGSGDSISEWRSSEQVENCTTSTSPPYWDTDDDDDCGPKPSDLYGRFTWKIENFSTTNKKELRSNVFEVGGYKWYILIYPQGCDVCNHLSLFLCVANHDKLLPGWNHFAQFTIAVVNKDPKKSKYSGAYAIKKFADTLHRFWKKEHDWGWKKFMELSKICDGFVDADTLVIKAQVQVIREKADRPFHCLDRQYRRELLRVYLSNVEQICRRFLDERIGKLSKLIEDKVKWSSFCAFWLGIDTSSRWRMSRDKTDAILKVVVKHFFIEKEVTSTLVMDSLYSGLKVLELQSTNMSGIAKVDLEELPAPIVCVDNDLFVLVDDVIPLIERVVSDLMPHQPIPSKDEKCLQNRTKDGSFGDECNKDSIERLVELGRKTIEIFALVHIFSSRIEVSYQEAIALKRQEELIREEEAAGLAENELKSKRAATEKERRAKKKQAKQKRHNREVKDKAKDERYSKVQETIQQEIHFSSASVELVIKKIEPPEDVSDVSDVTDIGDVVKLFQPDLEYRDAGPTNWDMDTSEIHLISEASGTAIQNGHMEKKGQYIVDDSSSTCSTDSVPSAFGSGSHKGNIWPNNIAQSSPNRGRNHQSKVTRNRKGSTHSRHNPPSGTTRVDDHAPYVISRKVSEQTELETEAIVTSKNKMQLEKDLVEKEEISSLQNKHAKINRVDVERHPSASGIEKRQDHIIQQPKQFPLVSSLHTVVKTSSTSLEPTSCKEPQSSSTAQSDQTFVLSSRSSPLPPISLIETRKPNIQTKKISSYQDNAMSRPSTAPLIPTPTSTAANAPTCQAVPLLSRSVSAAGRLGTDQSPSARNYIPNSYRNAIMGKNMSAKGAGFTYNNASSGQYVACSQTSSYLSSLLPPKVPAARKDQMSVGPGLTFGCLKPEVIHRQQLWRDDYYHESSSSQASGSNLVDSMEQLDINGKSQKELFTAGVASMITPNHVQGTMADEFPHLDIINDLLDDDPNVGLTARGTQHALSREYTLPGNLPTAEFTPIIGSGQYDQSEQYCEEGFLRGYGASNIPLQGLSDGLPLEYPPYACRRGQFEGLIRNHWPYGDNYISMLRLGNGDATGYSYQLQDYLKRGRNWSLYGHSDVP